MVARTRFELVISALRGRRPKPLDERAKWMAGMEGVEPPLTEPESAVLPLDDIPMSIRARVAALRKKVYYGTKTLRASPNSKFFETDWRSAPSCPCGVKTP